jgi:serine phosphatase RsbU (regulator of sigma subunit)
VSEETRRADGVELFFSYSHKDRDLREELERHLALLKRQGFISVWHDRQIAAGTEWEREIDGHINSAKVILLLVSADFISSHYCYDLEVKRAMERHDAGEARVIPVLLRAVDWHGAPFSRLQAVPTGGVPVTSWDNRDEALADVARAIRQAVTELAGRSLAIGAAQTETLTSDTPVAYFPSQRPLIDAHVRGFVGRGYVDKALDRFISTNRSGYFIIEAGPGLGKTAIAAHLAVTRSPVHHFIGRTGRRSDVRSIFASLITQLDRSARVEPLAAKSIDELLARFDTALHRRARDTSPLLLLFDALNELTPEDSEPLFLPTDGLPAGVYVIVTSQPGDRLTHLTEQLTSIPTQIYKLGPLQQQEVRVLIMSRQPDATDALIDRVERASVGNPLYIRATLDAVAVGSSFDLEALPTAVEGYFGRATRAVSHNRLLRDVLGFIGVSRKTLSLLDLSQLTESSQRVLDAEAVGPIRPFLLEVDGGYAFYHERFQDYVVQQLLYQDELLAYHRRMATWLDSPAMKGRDYYWTSLAYHLAETGDTGALERIDDAFLGEKLRRFGYAVLEDLELLAAASLSTADPSSVERCVARLEALREIVGGNVVDEIARSVQPNVRGPHNRGIALRFTRVPGIDAYAVLMPKQEVTADFVEVVPRNGRLVIAIGDAPMSGLKSAFVARFIARLFRSLVLAPGSVRLPEIMNQLSASISRHPYFERVSLQCVDAALDEGIMTMANAGHPYPVLYSTRYGRCDRLAVRGPLLHAGHVTTSGTGSYRARHAEISPGSVVVLVSDGITEAGPIYNPYGYRFTSVIERHVGASAKTIGEAIVSDWRDHRGKDAPADDATVLVLAFTGSAQGNSANANR